MSILFGLLLVGIGGLLLLVAAMQPIRPTLSHAELRRREARSHTDALALDRFELLPAVETLLRSLRRLLVVLFVAICIVWLGWWGLLLAVVVAVFYPSIARVTLLQMASQNIYRKIEHVILDGAAKYERVVMAIREPSLAIHEPAKKVDSREELAEVVAASKEVIGEKERLLLQGALAFPGKPVREVMTPRGVIDAIDKSEFLGPLVLTELHKLGHSRLPVIDGDLDHVIGVLHLRDLLSLDVKRSATAEKAMEAKVYYIREDDSLEHALAAFIRTRHHLFIVINGLRETVGVLTLEDVIEQLIGRRIVDEDDIHADLRAVAAQESRGNNSGASHVDL